MRILVVGGTGFLGGAVTRAAISDGHQVTVLSRGLEPSVDGPTAIVADRMDLPPLPDFDAVIDTCAYQPAMVDRLRDAMGAAHYVMVSSISAYDGLPAPMMNETAPSSPATQKQLAAARALPADRWADAIAYGADYGPLKRSCELAAGDDATIIRLGLIVGPGDKTDRFTWWVRQADTPGRWPLPGPPDRNMQIIDVADAAAFALRLATTRTSGTFNTTGPAMPASLLLSTLQSLTVKPATPDWRPLSDFTAAGFRHWTDLPLTLPDDPNLAHLMNVDTRRAQSAGLVCRSLTDTARRVLLWDRGRRTIPLRTGMTRAQATETFK